MSGKEHGELIVAALCNHQLTEAEFLSACESVDWLTERSDDLENVLLAVRTFGLAA